ncbi:hypothetical protein J4E86_008058 [Alternaria arbusti]|uniref:uncharacterized protein n=1 Tax=Alternaria arbusti TaxID=232088 RepID=UPI00221EDFC6|nr:uncharacterized protein J4E86_008058 [Alternaria arbusti]KAI4948710.1 hypothetical protein J4E86_008058 [Alternaria arbusti]
MDDRTGKDRDEIWVSKQVWRDLTDRNIRDDAALMSIPPTVHERVALEEQEQIAEEEAVTAKSNITKTGLAADSCPQVSRAMSGCDLEPLLRNTAQMAPNG